MTSWDKNQFNLDWSEVKENDQHFVAVILGTLLGWPIRATIVWALLLWAGLPLTLTWFQVFLLIGIIDFVRAR